MIDKDNPAMEENVQGDDLAQFPLLDSTDEPAAVDVSIDDDLRPDPDIFMAIHQGDVTLARCKAKFHVDEISGHSYARCEMSHGVFEMAMPMMTLSEYRSMLRLLLFLESLIDNPGGTANDRSTRVPFDALMIACKLKRGSRQKTLDRSRKDLENLWQTEIRYTTKLKGRYTSRAEVHILGARAEIEGGSIVVRFDETYSTEVLNRSKCYFNRALMRVNLQKTPDAITLGYAIYALSKINMTKKQRADTHSVKSLLEYCPSLPSYAEVMEKSKQVTDLIVAPFIKAMSALRTAGCFDYYFLEAGTNDPIAADTSGSAPKGMPDPLQVYKENEYRYADFISWKVKIIFTPDPFSKIRAAAIEAKETAAAERSEIRQEAERQVAIDDEKKKIKAARTKAKKKTSK